MKSKRKAKKSDKREERTRAKRVSHRTSSKHEPEINAPAFAASAPTPSSDRDPTCAELRRHAANCGCTGEAREPFAA